MMDQIYIGEDVALFTNTLPEYLLVYILVEQIHGMAVLTTLYLYTKKLLFPPVSPMLISFSVPFFLSFGPMTVFKEGSQ